MAKFTTTVEELQEIANNIKAEVDAHEKDGPYGNQNCMLCTWAVELQIRGQDFLPRPVISEDDIIFEKGHYNFVKGGKKEKFNSIDELVTNIKPGSRYYCHINWADSESGHEFLLVNIEDNVYIVDGQAGKVIPIIDDKEYFNDINFENSFIVRVDNKELNQEILALNNPEQMSTSALENITEALTTKTIRRDNENDFSPFGYKVNFYQDKKHIGEASVCGIKDDNAFLYDFIVYPEYRGKGYSKEMMKYMIEKYNIKELIVNKENEIAINLYKKFDFKIVNEFDDENDKTAYLMSKQ